MMKWLFLVSIPALFLAPVATDAAEPALIPIVKEDFSKDWEKRWRVSNGDGHGFAKVVDGRLVLMCGHGLSSAWLSSPLTGPYAVSATLRWVPWENHQARTAYVVFAGPGYGPSWRTGYAVKIAQNGEVAIFKEGTQICGGTAQKALFPGAFEVLVAKDGPHITVSVDGREAARTDDDKPLEGPLHQYVGLVSEDWIDCKEFLARSKPDNRAKLAKAAHEEPQWVPAKFENAERQKMPACILKNAFGPSTKTWTYVGETKRNLGMVANGWREFTAFNDSNLAWFSQPIKLDSFLLRYRLKYISPKDKNSVVVVCGSGVANIGDLMSGYAFCFGTPQGKNVILRQGTEAASTYYFHPVGGREYLMEIQKVGGKLRWFVDGAQLLEYEDSQPLQPGFLGFGSKWATKVRYGDVELWGEKR